MLIASTHSDSLIYFVPYSFCLTREPGELSASHPAPLPSPENLPPDTGDSEKLIFKAVLSLGSTRSSSSAGISQESHVRHSPPALCMLFPLLIPMHFSLPGSSGCNSPQISPEMQFWTAYRDFCQGTPANITMTSSLWFSISRSNVVIAISPCREYASSMNNTPPFATSRISSEYHMHHRCLIMLSSPSLPLFLHNIYGNIFVNKW